MHAEKGGEGRPIIRTKADLFISFIIPVSRSLPRCRHFDALTIVGRNRLERYVYGSLYIHHSVAIVGTANFSFNTGSDNGDPVRKDPIRFATTKRLKAVLARYYSVSREKELSGETSE